VSSDPFRDFFLVCASSPPVVSHLCNNRSQHLQSWNPGRQQVSDIVPDLFLFFPPVKDLIYHRSYALLVSAFYFFILRFVESIDTSPSTPSYILLFECFFLIRSLR